MTLSVCMCKFKKLAKVIAKNLAEIGNISCKALRGFFVRKFTHVCILQNYFAHYLLHVLLITKFLQI